MIFGLIFLLERNLDTIINCMNMSNREHKLKVCILHILSIVSALNEHYLHLDEKIKDV